MNHLTVLRLILTQFEFENLEELNGREKTILGLCLKALDAETVPNDYHKLIFEFPK